jgi:hypothetical protein
MKLAPKNSRRPEAHARPGLVRSVIRLSDAPLRCGFWSYCGGARLSQPKAGEGRPNAAIGAVKSHRIAAGGGGRIAAEGSR